MVNELIYNKLLELVPKENILVEEPMKKHTSFQVGGKADFFVMATDIKTIKSTLEISMKENIPLTIIGNGTNTLVRDGGIRGIVLKPDLKKFGKEFREDKIIYTCGSGLPVTSISKIALDDEVEGLEFAFGIPGTLGGAVRMNAGAYGSQMQEIVIETTYIDNAGECHSINNKEHEFEYRNSIFSKIQAVIIESKLLLKKGNKQDIEKKMQENKITRVEKQPLEFPSAGSTFKRGSNFITAKIIDECGLKGYYIGGAEVSTKHAGFIINKGNATAKDIINLIQFIKKEVKNKTGFDIEEEIQIIGEDN